MAEINNAFYQELGDAWWTANDHMITFLRAENAIRLIYMQKYLPSAAKPLRILDLGAGGGLITVPLAKMGHHVTAMDLSDASLDVLCRKAEVEGVRDRITTIQGDITKPWNLEGGYDVILAMDILEHVPDPKAVIQQTSQFLRPGGHFIYHTLNKTWLCWLIYLQLAPRIIRNSPKHVHVYQLCVKPSWMSRWLQELGFTHHEQVGIRPELHLQQIWQLLTRRQLDTALHFDFCRDLSLGYLGHACFDGIDSLKASV